MGDAFESILRASAGRRELGAEVGKRNGDGASGQNGAGGFDALVGDALDALAASADPVAPAQEPPDPRGADITSGESLAREIEQLKSRQQRREERAALVASALAKLGVDDAAAAQRFDADALTIEQARTWRALTPAERRALGYLRADIKRLNAAAWALLSRAERRDWG